MLIKCEKDAVENVYREVENVEEVGEVYVVNGEYDVLAKIVTSSPSDVPRAVLKLRRIPGVRATKTFTVVNLEA